MRKFALAALVAFAPATSFAFVPADVSSTTVMEVKGCKWQKKNCHGKNRVDIRQRNRANVDVQSMKGSRNDVYIDQDNWADVDVRGSRNNVYIQQSNEANVNIR